MNKLNNEINIENIIAAFENMKSIILSVVGEIMDHAKRMYDEIYNVYIAHGAPYGETHEGFMKWIEKMGKEGKKELEDG